MDNDTIFVSSVTHAMRAERLLARHGIWVQIGRQTNAEGRLGCGYYLRVRARDAARATALLRQAGVRLPERDAP